MSPPPLRESLAGSHSIRVTHRALPRLSLLSASPLLHRKALLTSAQPLRQGATIESALGNQVGSKPLYPVRLRLQGRPGRLLICLGICRCPTLAGRPHLTYLPVSSLLSLFYSPNHLLVNSYPPTSSTVYKPGPPTAAQFSVAPCGRLIPFVVLLQWALMLVP